jgi:brefeldin A-inhibited guanine nucleotide-exchange protein
LAKIGSSCLQQLILENVRSLQQRHWKKISATFVQLFETTTAYSLFNPEAMDSVSADTNQQGIRINGLGSDDHGVDKVATDQLTMEENGRDLENFRLQQEVQPSITAARKKEFKQIIVKCVLQLLMIETTSELLASDDVYEAMPSEELLLIMQVLRKSYRFARQFNNNRELRMNLLRIGIYLRFAILISGFMKQLPNLLKQESSAAATYISILLRMYNDPREERVQSKDNVEDALIPYAL